MIELKNIYKTYDKNTKCDVEALKGVSLALPDTGMVFIVGKSGGGKSTLLNILGGLEQYDEGDFLIDGVSTKYFSDANWDSYRNRFTGFVFQDHHLIADYNVKENVEFALALQHDKTENGKIEDALKTVDLAGFGERKISKLSGGQRQRVAIARALVKEYQIILADEPTGNLDAETAKGIFELLKGISQKKLVVVVTHDVNAANTYADLAIRIHNGRIVDSALTPGFSKKSGVSIQQVNGEKTSIIDTLHPQPSLEKATSASVIQDVVPLKNSAILKPEKIKNLSNNESVAALKLEKSKLSARMIWKVIGKSQKKRAVKLAVYIILSTVSFILLLSSLKLLLFQPYTAQVKNMNLEPVNLIAKIEQYERVTNGIKEKANRNIPFSENDLTELRSQFPNSPIYEINDIQLELGSIGRPLTQLEETYYSNQQDGFCGIDEAALKSFGYSLLAGEYPNETWEDNDIMLSKNAYELYALCGIESGGIITSIKSYEDLINNTVYLKSNNMRGISCTVRGIIDTHFDDEEIYKSVNEYALDSLQKPPLGFLRELYNNYRRENWSITPHNIVFAKVSRPKIVGKSYYVLQKNEPAHAKEKAKFIINSNRYEFADYYTRLINNINSYKHDKNALAVLCVLSSVTFAFALFLIVNFIVTSINGTKKEIGIFRCVGVCKKDILSIYLIEAGIFALTVFILSLIIFTFVCLPYLGVFEMQTFFLPFSMFSLSMVDVLILGGILLSLSFLSVILPFINIVRKPPNQILTE